MRQGRAGQPRYQQRPSIYVPQDLKTSTYVFVRRDAVPKPLQQPYDGPFKVMKRRDKHFLLNLGDRTDTVSVDRLKPAHLATATNTRPSRHISASQPSAFPFSTTTHKFLRHHVTWAAPLCSLLSWVRARVVNYSRRRRRNQDEEQRT